MLSGEYIANVLGWGNEVKQEAFHKEGMYPSHWANEDLISNDIGRNLGRWLVDTSRDGIPVSTRIKTWLVLHGAKAPHEAGTGYNSLPPFDPRHPRTPEGDNMLQHRR